MMMKKTAVAAAMLFALTANVAFAAEEIIDPPAPPAPTAPTVNQGSGDITFVGAIIDAPCSISPESSDQTVEMGQVSNATLANNGEGRMQDFTIKLEGCDFKTAASVDVTFTGMADGTAVDKLALNGTAKGAAIQMLNQQSGKAIELGKASNISGLAVGDNEIKFGAKLVKTASTKDDIIPGEYSAKTHFVMQYK